jgi:VWFA-related protein
MAHWPIQKTLFLSLISVGLLVGMSTAQNQIRSRVDLVVVPVTVRAPGGRLVVGLTREDFSITEDGKPQAIVDFDIEPQTLSAAIILDDGMSGDKLRRLFPPGMTPLWLTLTAGFGSEDQMAAFRYDHEVHRLTDFTSDQKVIQESFSGIEEIAKIRPDEPADMLGEKGPGWLRSILSFLRPGPGYKPAPGGGAPIPSASTPVKSAPRPSNRVLHDAIYEAAVALSSQPAERRKIIFIISDGSAYGAPAHPFKETLDLLLKNEIQVFGVSADFGRTGSYGNLSEYAGPTGGDVYPGTSTRSMETAFGRITEQARNQYILTYVSNNMTDRGVFRTINVKTRSSKDTVTHRRGYMQYPVQ